LPEGVRILCAGVAVQDIVMRVDRFPAPGSKVPGSDFLITGGGCAANAALAVARLGGRAFFAGPLGDAGDAVSDRIVADLQAAGIDCTGVERVPGAIASVSLILVDATGEKSIATRRGHGLTNGRPADAAALVAGADLVLVDNRYPDFALPIGRAARARGLPLVIDVDRATTPDDPLLALGTHVIASSEALATTTDTGDVAAGLAALAGRTAGFVAVTAGGQGVWWREREMLRHMPAFPVAVVDTLGAGDVFHGAFALALAESGDPVSALRFGTAVAALKCMRFGGGSGTPTRPEVEALLRSQGRRPS
jgi:sugar/nucleoside kinase (ribokinase family)